MSSLRFGVGLLSRILVLAAILWCGTAAAAAAQGIPYVPSSPTPGAPYADGQNTRYLLGGAWLYRADPTDVGVTQGFWRDISAPDGWSPLSVPNAFNAGDLSAGSFNGSVGWYRRDFTVPANAFPAYVANRERFWIVRFESVNLRATVWCNGVELGSHVGAFLPFELLLKNLRPGLNRLTVRVDDRRGAGDLPPGPGGGWWNYGGILREVLLRAASRVDISALRVRPRLPCVTCAATIEEQATLTNLTSGTQTVQLRGRFGAQPISFPPVAIPAGATRRLDASLPVAHPRLWSPGTPYLYRASLALLDGQGRALGGWVTRSGIRRIAVNPQGQLTLNGRLLNLRGVNLHEQDPVSGGAISLARTRQLLEMTRALGATLIRAHYPLSPELQELADSEGLLIWLEIPVYQVSSRYLSDPGWLAGARATLQNNIVTNQNHPSVLLWSIGNELNTPVDAAEAAYIRAAAALARKLDPTRPVALAISSWPGVGCQSAYAPLDVVGYNDYFGWYDAGGGTTDDRDALSPFLDTLRACYPKKALMVSEFGFEANRPGPAEERGTYAFQADATAYHLAVFATKPWLSGAIYFALQEFLARPGWSGGDPLPNPPVHQKGIFDFQGNPKPVASVISSSYRATAQIGSPQRSRRDARQGSRSGL